MQEDLIKNYNVTKEEEQEYLAYHSYRDVLYNLKSGVQQIKDYDLNAYKNSILVCGAMAAFDKRVISFLNKWQSQQQNLFLLSEVTAQYRRYTKEYTNIPFICTPHLLAKEMVVLGMNIPITIKMWQLYKKKKYVKEAVKNFKKRHINIGKGYALVWGYYAYYYISKLIENLQPKKVILWNEFYAFHHIFQGICKERKIPLLYMEFGCLPGTICIEERGQQGESIVAREYKLFSKKEISDREIEKTKNVLRYLKETGMNRNIQPIKKMQNVLLQYYKAGRKTILYLGQNDYESGMYPYTYITKKFHSPIFRTSLDALQYLRLITIKNNWNLIYKPHPIMCALKQSESKITKNIDIITDVDINSAIDFSDLVITILSQGAYISLIRNNPVLMLGYTQLYGKDCTYEAFLKREIEEKIETALEKGFTIVQNHNFIKHTTQILKYYLYDDGVDRKLRFGKDIESNRGKFI